MSTSEVLTAAQLQAATGSTLERAAEFLPAVKACTALFAIDSGARLAAFLAQVGHESGHLVYTREIWGPTAAQRSYEGRADLGNTQAGDGQRFMGRGLIQVTGRANYRAATQGMRAYMEGVPDFEANPVLLEQTQWATASACWFWRSRALSPLADAGQFELITRRINGGLNGLDDRLALWAKAKAALGVT